MKKNTLTFSKNNNKIILTTVSSWLTQIEFKRNKLFVTKRIRLMNRKPVDYDFGDGTMAFLTNNQVCLTLPTPESIIQSKFECNQDKSNSSEEKLVYGNSTLISLSFNILPFEENDKITNIGYISTNKLIAWCDKSLYLIDLQTRKITEPLKKIFDRLSNTITQIFFSKSNTGAGQATFISNKSFKLIGSHVLELRTHRLATTLTNYDEISRHLSCAVITLIKSTNFDIFTVVINIHLYYQRQAHEVRTSQLYLAIMAAIDFVHSMGIFQYDIIISGDFNSPFSHKNSTAL